jgi:DNA (cytosine-5)-methyltransferase 3A
MEETVDEKFYYNKPFTLDGDKTKNVIGTIALNTYEANKRVFNPDGIIGCLTCVSGGYQEKKVYDDKTNRVRKLTPIEYERLQGLPDNYTAGVANSKRYTACGNGWCIPVIEYILGGLEWQ